MNLTQTCSHLLLGKDILQIQVINPNLNVVFHINDYFSFKTKGWVVGQYIWSGLAVSGQVHLELFPCGKVVHLTCAIFK